MKLIAGSGSTKTSWCLFGKKGVTQYFSTNGINTFFGSTEDIANELLTDLMPKTGTEIQQVHFYGASIINPKKRRSQINSLSTLFHSYMKILPMTTARIWLKHLSKNLFNWY